MIGPTETYFRFALVIFDVLILLVNKSNTDEIDSVSLRSKLGTTYLWYERFGKNIDI